MRENNEKLARSLNDVKERLRNIQTMNAVLREENQSLTTENYDLRTKIASANKKWDYVRLWSTNIFQFASNLKNVVDEIITIDEEFAQDENKMNQQPQNPAVRTVKVMLERIGSTPTVLLQKKMKQDVKEAIKHVQNGEFRCRKMLEFI